jgi:Phage capsid family
VGTTTADVATKADDFDSRITALAEEATTIVHTVDSEGREFTKAEDDRIKAIFTEAKTLRDLQSRAQGRQQLRESIEGLASPGDAAALNADALKGATRGVKGTKGSGSIGQMFVDDPAIKSYLGQWPDGIPDSTKNIRTPPFHVGGLKALLTSTTVEPLIQNDYRGLLPFPQQPLIMRNLVTSGTTTSDTIEFARVTAVNSNAAPVPEASDTAGSGVKPQSDLAFERVTSPVRTIAHWMAATKRSLSDVGQLRTMIDGFLRYGLEEVLESEMLNGDGTGDHFLGILNTPGISSQPWATDMVTTIRKAVTQIQVQPVMQPDAIILNPADDEAIDLLKGTDGHYLAGSSSPWVANTPRTIWGLARVVSNVIPAGTALVGGFRAAVLWDRERSTISVSDQHEDFFIRNLIAVLAELRAAFGVLQPQAFCEVDLTAL